MRDTLERLRHLLHGLPTENAWWGICELLDPLGDDELALALQYVDQNADAWPDRLRFAPPLWLHDALLRRPQPRLRAVRAILEPEPNRRPGAPPPITDVPHPWLPLRNVLFNPDALATLLGLPQLHHVTTLHLPWTQGINHSLLPRLARLARPPLQTLVLRQAVAPDGLLELASHGGMAALRELELRHSAADTTLARLLADWPFPHLHTLRLDAKALGPNTAEALLHHPNTANLVELQLEGVTLSASGIATLLRRATRLERLRLDRCTADGDVADRLRSTAPLPALRHVSLTTQAPGRPLEGLLEGAAIAHVERLDVIAYPGGAEADKLATRLAANPHARALRHLVIGRSLSDAGVTALAHSPHLAGLTAFELGPRNFDPNGVTIAGIQELVSRLALKELRVDKAHVGDQGATLIAHSLAAPHLEILSMLDGKVGPDGARALAESPALGQLRELNLIANPIGDEGLTAIANSPSFDHLQILKLYRAGVGDQGVAAIANSTTLTSLRDLTLGANSLTQAVVPALAASPLIASLDWFELPDNYDLAGDARAALAAIPHWPLHLKVSLSGGLNPWSWTLDDALRLPPCPETIETLHFHVRTMPHTQLPTLDRARIRAILDRHWPDELARKLRERLSILGFELGDAGA